MSSWESCVHYLRSAELLPHRCDASNVVGYIKDGAVLCRLLNYLKPFSVDSKQFSQNPRNSKFLSSKNIQVFLGACKSSFSMEEEDLFQVGDLLNEENTDKVLEALTKMLNSDLAQKRLRPLGRDPMPLPAKDENYGSSYEDEKIYQRAIDLFPQTIKAAKDRKSPKERCIDELITTEKKYIKILELLLKKHRISLVKMLKPSENDFIFLPIEKMYGVHAEFLKALTDTLEDDSRVTIAECFISNKEKFLDYGLYCSRVTQIQALIDEVVARPGYRETAEVGQNSVDGDDVKLRDLFIVPVQRILKYPLFVKNCLENTEDDNQTERRMLSKALEEIEDLAQCVNEVKRDFENINNINRIESSIKYIASSLPEGAHLRDYGRLLKDGEVKCKTLNKLCTLFLFDKLLLLCFKTKDKDLLELSKFFVTTNFTTRQRQERYFALLNAQQVTEFKAKTREERDDWIKKLEMARESISPTIPWARDTPPPRLDFTTFTEITICDVCRKLLKGVFFQGYHCQNPKINVHRECIPKLQHEDILKIPHEATMTTGTNRFTPNRESWYAGDIDRMTAELLLEGSPDGTYLVRSKDSGYVITIKYDKVYHILIEGKKGRFGIGDAKSYNRIQDIVHFYQENSLENLYPGLLTKLVHPYKVYVVGCGSPRVSMDRCSSTFKA